MHQNIKKVKKPISKINFKRGRVASQRGPSKFTTKKSTATSARKKWRWPKLPSPTLKEMLQANVHLGHLAKQWNPEMEPFLYGQKNNRHFLDLVKSRNYLKRTCRFLQKEITNGSQVLFVATKKQAAPEIRYAAHECNAAYVNQKWLGGILTNWTTVSDSIQQLRTLQNDFKYGRWKSYTKKEQSRMNKKRRRLEKTIGGLVILTEFPKIIIIIGQCEEVKALKECNRLASQNFLDSFGHTYHEVRSISIVDTDCSPRSADLFVPANDDSVSSIKLILKYFAPAIRSGNKLYLQRHNFRVEKRGKQTKKMNRA